MRLMLSGGAALGAAEARVLGCLLEKQRTTPDAYPLSLNSLRLACNQSTNRDPVVAYDEAVVREALHRLERSGIVRLASGAGSRAPKYRHLLAERLPLSRAQEAVVCVLLLRGPQTPGELKQRCERMHAFASLQEVQDALQALIEQGLVERLRRRPGQKEERYRELLQEGERETGADPGAHAGAGAPPIGASPSPQPPGAGAVEPAADDGAADLHERVARLEREVAELRAQLERGSELGEEAQAESPDPPEQPVATVEGL